MDSLFGVGNTNHDDENKIEKNFKCHEMTEINHEKTENALLL